MNEQLNVKERKLSSQTDSDSLLLLYKVNPGKWVVMYLCVRNYDVSVRFWNCFNIVGLFLFSSWKRNM